MQDPPSTSPETKAVQDVLPSIESNTCLRMFHHAFAGEAMLMDFTR